MEEDGLLSADDALTALLPDVEMADGRSACKSAHLMTHTAGVAADFPDEFQDVWPETAEESAGTAARSSIGCAALIGVRGGSWLRRVRGRRMSVGGVDDRRSPLAAGGRPE